MNTNQTRLTPSHVAAAKAITTLVVIAIIFAVRTTGALHISVLDQDDIAVDRPNPQGNTSTVPNPADQSGTASTSPPDPTTSTGDSTSATATPTTPASPYRDGTYTATGSYDTPEGIEHIGVTFTLSGGTITATSATNEARNRTSRLYQNDFIAGYKSYVVGKSIKDLQLYRVSGASLTPIGFNDAVDHIRSQAS